MIAAKLAAMDDILNALRLLGMFMVTVIVGLLIHVFVVLPVIYVTITRKNPYRFMSGLREAMVTAFGTDSRLVFSKSKAPCLDTKEQFSCMIGTGYQWAKFAKFCTYQHIKTPGLRKMNQFFHTALLSQALRRTGCVKCRNRII